MINIDEVLVVLACDNCSSTAGDNDACDNVNSDYMDKYRDKHRDRLLAKLIAIRIVTNIIVTAS